MLIPRHSERLRLSRKGLDWEEPGLHIAGSLNNGLTS